MTSKQLLIISNNKIFWREKLAASPPEKYSITSASSLAYISLGGFHSVIFDMPEITAMLKKISLGICDTEESMAIWKLLNLSPQPETFVFSDKKTPPSTEMRALNVFWAGISDIIQLIAEQTDAARSHNSESRPSSAGILTADDIRVMHQNGHTQIPAEAKLTPWAQEVADALNLKLRTKSINFLLPVTASSKKDIADKRELFFEASTRFPELLFVISPALLPLFNSLYPSLQGKTVSPTIAWASHGAFTGETCASMLADMRCHGAIVPETSPYNDPQKLLQIIDQAQKNDLTLFSTFTLASTGSCDIIASEKYRNSVIPLFPKGISDISVAVDHGAIIVDENFLREQWSRKEMN